MHSDLRGRLRSRLGIEYRNRRNEAVPPLGQCFNKARIFGIVTQCFAQLVYRDAQTVIEINGGIGIPKPLLESFAGQDLAGLLKQCCKQFEGLPLKPDAHTGPAQFSGLQIGFKDAELYPFDFVDLRFPCHDWLVHLRPEVYRNGGELNSFAN
jgi:hypothetical protein